jgi:serine/threonine protein kinase
MKCPKCNTVNALDSKFCKECASPLPSSREFDISQTETLVPPNEDLTTGTIFGGRYQFIEELGHGGMGKVYKAFDRETNSKVALKLIKPEVAADKTTIERFRNELRVARDISHKNICRMYDLGKEADHYYIVMEYVHGEDLKKIMGKMGLLSAGQAISIAKQVCEGLSEAHKLGIIHRDLKPSNIMVDDSGNVRIMDFGIARSVKSKGITGSGVIIGTPEYMSPEQVEGKTPDQRSDIYSLGIVLYELLAGKLPFEGETPLVVGIKHKTEHPEEPKKINPQIPDELNQLIMKCLSKQREARYQSADELFSELLRLEKKIPTSKRIVPVRKPTTSREITLTLNLKKLLIPGLAVAATAAIVILIVLFVHKPPPEPPPAAFHKQLTFTGNASDPAISPDGKFFAYITSQTFDEQAVLIQDMVSGQSLELLCAGKCRKPRWTSDGSEVSLWASMKDSSSGYYVIPRLGGTPRHLVTAEYLAWSPDGSHFASCEADSKDIRITNKTTGESRSISLGSPVGTIHGLEWSPKEEFLLLHSVYGSHKYGVWTIPISGGEQHEVVEGDVDSPRWSPKESAIYYKRYQPPASYEILKVWISPKTGMSTQPPSIVTSQPGEIMDPAIASDGKKLLYVQQTSSSNLWLATASEVGKGPTAEAEPFTKGTFYDMCPSVSPDGKTIAFSRGVGGVINIFVMPLEGGSPRQISYMNSLNFYPVWSPDGSEIAFTSNQERANRAWKVSIHGGTPSQFKDSKLADISDKIAWAPGKYILALGEKGPIILYPDTGREVPLLKDGSKLNVREGLCSPDGKKIAVLGNRSPDFVDGLWLISLGDSSEVLLRQGELFPIGWSSDGKSLYASESVPGTIKVIMVALESKEAKTLFMLPFTLETGRPYNFQVTMTPDAKRFLFPALKTESDVWVIENFDKDVR